MGKIIAIAVIAAVAWFIYNGTIDVNKVNSDLDKAKNNSIEALKNEKTINSVNSTRARTQEDVNRVTK